MSDETHESKAPTTKKEGEGSDHMSIAVKGQDGTPTHFKIKKNTKLEKLMTVFCERRGVPADSIVFLFDGNRVRPDQVSI